MLSISRGNVYSRRSAVRCTAAQATPACPKLIQQAKLTAAVASAWRSCPAAQQQDIKSLKSQLASSVQSMGALVLPFAATAMAAGGQGEIYGALAKALDVYMAVLTVRVLLSWFKNINWMGEPWNTLRQFTDPYLNIFRGIIPSLGGMDLSPMIGFFLLSFVRNQMHRVALYSSV